MCGIFLESSIAPAAAEVAVSPLRLMVPILVTWGGTKEVEATLDVTWAIAVAPSAFVNLVVSASTDTTDGVDLSALYIIDNNLASLMTESFGICEQNFTAAQKIEIPALVTIQIS